MKLIDKYREVSYKAVGYMNTEKILYILPDNYTYILSDSCNTGILGGV